MKSFLLIVFLSLFTAPSFPQAQQEFMNRMTPVYPGCDNAKDRHQCYVIGVGKLIVSKLNEKKYKGPKHLQIELLIRTEKDGKSTVLRTASKGTGFVPEKIVKEALQKMPLVKPMKSAKGKNESSSMGFFVIADWNEHTKKYEHVYK
ncbi:hypothetical protein [Flavobacterium sp.]